MCGGVFYRGFVGACVGAPSVPGPFELDRRLFRLRFRMCFGSTRESIPMAIDQVMRIAAACGCEDSHADDMEIALSEAIANAVLHGNASDSEKSVVLRCYGSPGKAMIVIVRDEGAGFDPGDVPDPREPRLRERPHGRGLFLMRQMMDAVLYRKGGREVVLYKACPIPPAS